MADIKITDNFSLETGLTIRDDSPLAKAKITQLLSTSKDLFADFDKPMDQADEKSFALGSSFTSPDLLSSDLPGLTIGVGINSQISIFKTPTVSCSGKTSSPRSFPLVQIRPGWVLNSISAQRILSQPRQALLASVLKGMPSSHAPLTRSPRSLSSHFHCCAWHVLRHLATTQSPPVPTPSARSSLVP